MSTNIFWQESPIGKTERQKLLNQKGCVVWITGLSGSGKSTLACSLSRELYTRGKLSYILDGDNLRHGLNKDLGFKAEDRVENIRRVGARFFPTTCLTHPQSISTVRRRNNSSSLTVMASSAQSSEFSDVFKMIQAHEDLLANPKCSLLVARDPEDRTGLRITLHGDAVLVVSDKDQAAVRSAYLAKHPNAFWVDFGDFSFVRIEPKVVRFVSGVATAFLGSGEFSKEEYQTAKVVPTAQFAKPVTSHMNKDHEEDTIAIVHHATSIPVESALMLDLDSLGFNVKATLQGNTFKIRVPFPRRAQDRKDVKTLIVEMLQAANFMRIEPKVVTFVSGVATAFLGSGEFSKEEYQAAKVDPIAQFAKPVTSHMNKDHEEDTKAIVHHTTSIPVESALMLDLDSLGFNVKATLQGNTFKIRVPFPRRAQDRKDVKTLIVEMLQAAKRLPPLHISQSCYEQHFSLATLQGNTFKIRVPFPRRAQDRKDVKTLIVEMLQAAKSVSN
ncbi:hypothetical protein F2Q68_00018360 [Brassica cretica]|uniref:Adenylyl-sulfate kinase n=1 Tax=Brassica cretica TaxID=69181 RepID=A0A8S9HFI8_BRACR|nr:hypothetical protein F2Q68_00018360 [Brassica cretica]